MLPPDMHHLAKIVVASSILAGVPAQAVTEINCWLWDNNQLASYQACAEAFEKQNPDIKIKITQTGWFDYWTALSTAFVSGTAPDVFWDHLSRYPEFISNNLLVDLAPLIGRDKVSIDIYVGGLVKVWGKNGKQYGLPKGIDVSAFVDEAKDPQGTFFLPITDHGNDAVRILRATFDVIFLDGADAAPKLQAANQEIDSLFQ
jgi:multiple sugar transport system substrate-binding protein